MNEELIQESYDYFKEGGFTGSLDQYKNLLVTNPKALDVTHQYFTSQKQYQGTVDDLALDLGVKKKTIPSLLSKRQSRYQYHHNKQYNLLHRLLKKKKQLLKEYLEKMLLQIFLVTCTGQEYKA